MKSKKIISIFLAVVMTFGLAACSSGKASNKTVAPTAKTKTKVVAWAYDHIFNIGALNAAKAIYEKAHPGVEIDVVEMSSADIIQKLNTNLSAGTNEGLPNIVLIEDYRAQNFLGAYKDSFQDISNKVKSTDFLPYKAKAASIDGKLYGLPFDCGVAGLFYRTDLIEKAGYTKADMNNITWDKYIEIGKAVKAKTGKEMLTLDPSDLGLIKIMLQSAGSWYYKKDGKTIDIANNAALKGAIKTWKELITSGIVKVISGGSTYASAYNTGAVASVPTGCWGSGSIMSEKDQSGKWAVAPIPRMSGVSTSINDSNQGGSAWYVLKNAGDTATTNAAVDFLSKTFGGSTDLMNTLMTKISLVSALKASKTVANYKSAIPFYGGQKLLEDFGTWAAKVQPINYGENTYAIEDILTGAIQNIVSKNANIDKSLEDVQKQAESEVSN